MGVCTVTLSWPVILSVSCSARTAAKMCFPIGVQCIVEPCNALDQNPTGSF